jgi:hypothetical protein
MGNCDPYSDSPEPLVVNNHSLLGSKEPTLLCNLVPYEDFKRRITGRVTSCRIRRCGEPGLRNIKQRIWLATIASHRCQPRFLFPASLQLRGRFRKLRRHSPEKRRRAAFCFGRYLFLDVLEQPRHFFIQTSSDFLKFVHGQILPEYPRALDIIG